MPVVVAQHAGFCMGVRRAVNEALQGRGGRSGNRHLRELVHNPQVIEKLESVQVSAVHEIEQARGKTVMIRSHGVAPAVTAKLREAAGNVIDLTCPFVARLHDVVARYSADGSPVILVGQADHPEVIAPSAMDKDRFLPFMIP